MDGSDLRPLFARRLGRGPLVGLDCLAAAAYTAALFGTVPAGFETGLPAWARYLVAACVGLPVAVRRLWPLPVFGIVAAVSVLAAVLGMMTDPFIAAAFALYTVALISPRPVSMSPPVVVALATVGTLTALLSLVGVSAPMPGTDAANDTPSAVHRLVLIVFGCALMGGAWTLGHAVRERRELAARSAARLAERAVTEERLRIARELHDVVSHTLSLIGVKAGVARHVADSRPEEVREALRVIEVAGRDALTEMRHYVGVLRSEGTPVDLGPVPGLAGLPELTDRAAMAGVTVDMDVHAEDRLPEGVELSIYRIVQEALTNVVKHAAPARCRVVVADDGGEVCVEVTDDGPGVRVLPDTSGEAGGHGHVGMRERALMYGGEFAAGPRPEGGFGVSVRLPYRPVGEGP